MRDYGKIEYTLHLGISYYSLYKKGYNKRGLKTSIDIMTFSGMALQAPQNVKKAQH